MNLKKYAALRSLIKSAVLEKRNSNLVGNYFLSRQNARRSPMQNLPYSEGTSNNLQNLPYSGGASNWAQKLPYITTPAPVSDTGWGSNRSIWESPHPGTTPAPDQNMFNGNSAIKDVLGTRNIKGIPTNPKAWIRDFVGRNIGTLIGAAPKADSSQPPVPTTPPEQTNNPGDAPGIPGRVLPWSLLHQKSIMNERYKRIGDPGSVPGSLTFKPGTARQRDNWINGRPSNWTPNERNSSVFDWNKGIQDWIDKERNMGSYDVARGIQTWNNNERNMSKKPNYTYL